MNGAFCINFSFAGQVSALVTMYSHEEDIDSAIEVFTQAIQWYQSHQVKERGEVLEGCIFSINKVFSWTKTFRTQVFWVTLLKIESY